MLFDVISDVEGRDFTICSWSVCSLSRHGAVCAVVFLTVVANSGDVGVGCLDMGVGKEGQLSLQLVPHSMYLHGMSVAMRQTD